MKLVLFFFATTALLAQNDDKIWTGVYSSAQAARGKAAFEKSCSNCHNATLAGTARAPSLKGDRFMGNWLNTSLNTLFTKLRDTMPATYPETVPDEVKLDILTYLLQSNSFPAGSADLKLVAAELDNIQIVRQGSREVPNFALVEMVGCLAQGPGNSGWTLTRTSEPVVTKDEAGPAVTNKPLGSDTYVLVSVTAFNPAPHLGHKMEARGLLYREPGENRLNLTSLNMAASECR